jgi:hypothetical protein
MRLRDRLLNMIRGPEGPPGPQGAPGDATLGIQAESVWERIEAADARIRALEKRVDAICVLEE